jgi:hypothetical protein
VGFSGWVSADAGALEGFAIMLIRRRMGSLLRHVVGKTQSVIAAGIFVAISQVVEAVGMGTRVVGRVRRRVPTSTPWPPPESARRLVSGTISGRRPREPMPRSPLATTLCALSQPND